MDRIEGQLEDQKELAKQVLSWIICGKRPLTTSELQYALAIEVGDSELDKDNLPQVEDILSVCAGLVTVDEESSIIRLVHYTTQEYFDRTRAKWFPSAEANITTTCVTYLSFDEFESGICANDGEFEQRLQLNKLYDYAAHNWGYHARQASTLCQGVIEFLQKRAQVEASSQALIAIKHWPNNLGYSERIPRKMTGLHLAAYFGVDNAVQFLISSNNPNSIDSYGRTPLSWAARNGHEGVVQLLLATGQVDVNWKDQFGQTPLYWASRRDRRELIRLLLEKGADAKAANSNGWTPLHRATDSGHVEVVWLLLEKGADANAANSMGWTPLQRASLNGHVEVARLLLGKGADVNAANFYGVTPLISAASNGKVDVVKLLLAIDRVEPDLKDRTGRTPLFHAAKNGNKAIVELLLAINRVDADSRDYYNSTLLSVAARMGRGDVVALFLTKGLALNIEDNSGRTPLWWAKKNGYPEIADLLLKKSRENGIFIQEDDLPITTIPVLADATSRWCDVCILGILEKDTYYHCSVCIDGDFDICKECFAMKAHCLDKSHTISRNDSTEYLSLSTA
jgi:ankyrin repeat protein